VKNKKVLSFAEGEDSDDDDDAPEIKKGGAHDLLKDERLKKEAAVPTKAAQRWPRARATVR